MKQFGQAGRVWLLVAVVVVLVATNCFSQASACDDDDDFERPINRRRPSRLVPRAFAPEDWRRMRDFESRSGMDDGVMNDDDGSSRGFFDIFSNPPTPPQKLPESPFRYGRQG